MKDAISVDTLLSDEKIRKAAELSIQDQNDMAKKAQDTSLDDILEELHEKASQELNKELEEK